LDASQSRLTGVKQAALLILFLSFAGVFPLSAATMLPAGFVEEIIVGPWSEPVGLTFEPEQTSGGRMYVWERAGRVWIVENGIKVSPPLIDISEEVGGWRDFGLLGFAFHPNFRQSGYIYLAYTVDHHHLTKFGAPDYDPAANEYFMATIHRITRYTARAADDFRSVDYGSRKILLGESITNGFPSLYQSHGIGSLVFGTDGTLLAGCGDGASYNSMDVGSASETYFSRALAEGIIQPKENVGAFRSQIVDSLSGKIIRIDPETGDGIPGNPFFDADHPRSARSRVWSLGVRNPYRMTLRPGTGSHQRSDANPGALYFGDVAWDTFEDLNVATAPGQNFGWPVYEGLQSHSGYRNSNVGNQDAPNPLFGIGGCTQPYFYFRDLIVQDSLNTLRWTNPCNTNQQVPASIPRFAHRRPAIDWQHVNGPARTGIYNTNGSAAVVNIGASNSPVSGPQFGGTSSIGGTWYQGDDFPAQYKNTYFHGDFEGQWIRNFVFDTNDNPVAVRPFLTGGGGIVCIATHPVDGGLYYVTWTNGIKRVRYIGGGNKSPLAVATADKSYGLAPLTVQFDGNESSDPEMLPVTYQWDFGDGSMISTQASPSHTFSAPAGVPISYPVTLTVTDNSNATAQATLLISVNNTPPSVTITSPTNGMLYPLTNEITYTLSASISDAEHSADQLACEWQTILHHNSHTHADPPDTNCATTTVISPIGCNDATYFYRITLKVTDAAGLATTREVRLYPDCGQQPSVLKYLGRDGTGAIRWELTGATNRNYVVEGSTNLIGWSSITNVQPAVGTAEFTDSSAGAFQFRFYRAVLVP
jgi:glucose/arabinose dehydrogenase